MFVSDIERNDAVIVGEYDDVDSRSVSGRSVGSGGDDWKVCSTRMNMSRVGGRICLIIFFVLHWKSTINTVDYSHPSVLTNYFFYITCRLQPASGGSFLVAINHHSCS